MYNIDHTARVPIYLARPSCIHFPGDVRTCKYSLWLSRDNPSRRHVGLKVARCHRRGLVASS